MQQNNIMLFEFIRLICFSGLWLCLSIYEQKHEVGKKQFDGYILSYAAAASLAEKKLSIIIIAYIHIMSVTFNINCDYVLVYYNRLRYA